MYFIFDGSPAQWPAFEPDQNLDDTRLQLDPGYETLHSFRKAECALWAVYAAQK